MTLQSGSYDQDDELAQIELSLFLDIANRYRDFGISRAEACGAGEYAGWCDPRTAGPKLAELATWAGPWGANYLYAIIHSPPRMLP